MNLREEDNLSTKDKTAEFILLPMCPLLRGYTDPSANVTAVWLGVMIGLNIQTSFLTPPFGFALFYLRGVAPVIVKTIEMYRGVVVFIILQLVALGIVAVYPRLVNYLPNRVSLTSDTAPPPRNPQLQFCVEEYVVGQLAENGAAIQSGLADVRALDLSVLPKKLASNTSKGFDSVETAIGLFGKAREAGLVMTVGAVEYRPLHTTTRIIERQVRGLNKEIKKLETNLRYFPENAEVSQKIALEQLIVELKTESEQLHQSIPEEWPDAYAKFSTLRKAANKARMQYRRAADKGYGSATKLLDTLRGTTAFNALESALTAMREQVEVNEPADMLVPLKTLSGQFGSIEGASKIKSHLSKARRALKARKPSKGKALKEMDKAIKLYEEQKVWRAQATAPLLPALTSYEEIIRNTIGIRQQKRLTQEQALYVASCNSGNRDVSLNF